MPLILQHLLLIFSAFSLKSSVHVWHWRKAWASFIWSYRIGEAKRGLGGIGGGSGEDFRGLERSPKAFHINKTRGKHQIKCKKDYKNQSTGKQLIYWNVTNFTWEETIYSPGDNGTQIKDYNSLQALVSECSFIFFHIDLIIELKIFPDKCCLSV